MKLIPLQSSQIAGVGYDISSMELYVEFNNFDVYRYDNVSPEELCAVLFADSQGRMFNAVIKPKPYEKLDGLPEGLDV